MYGKTMILMLRGNPCGIIYSILRNRACRLVVRGWFLRIEKSDCQVIAITLLLSHWAQRGRLL